MNSEPNNLPGEVPIVLVHLGNNIPLYLKLNLRYLKNLGGRIVLVTDSIKIAKSNRRKGLEVFLFEGTPREVLRLSSSLDHNHRFREGFWYKAIIRFFALEAYMKMSKEEQLIHLESDVWISPNFPARKLLDNTKGLAFPLCNATTAIPSVFVVKQLKALIDFNHFSESKIQSDPKATDMSLLSEFQRINPNVVTLLPTLNRALIRHSMEDEVAKLPALVSKDWDGIFDANTIGQYFFGWDPRNERGYRLLFQNYNEHFVNPARARLFFEESRLFISKDGEVSPIFNLHLHSKDFRIFISYLLPMMVWFRSIQSIRGPKRQKTIEIIARRLRSLRNSIIRNINLVIRRGTE